jgi:hypothetical protein
MRNIFVIFGFWAIFSSCSNSNQDMSIKNKAIFLHHSTGNNIWKGKTSKFMFKLFNEGDVQKWIQKYNKENRTNYSIVEQSFPKKELYGWNNYPYDYYNIWVKNAGNKPYMNEPTLEILTKQFGVIIWKHCFPVSHIKEDTGNPDIESNDKRVENYKLQYDALKKKMHEFPETKFIVWTGAALVKESTTEEEAKRMGEFVGWIKNVWEEEGDNIYIWDFYNYETEGGLYLKDENAFSKRNSHPNASFSAEVASLFARKIVEVMGI